jgi:cytochrome c peroxidase
VNFLKHLVGAALLASALTLGYAALESAGSSDRQPMDEAMDLALDRLAPPPPDPGNRWADDARAADLGHRLFFDPRLSANGKVACATCHDPSKSFQDDIPLAKGVGTTDRRTMPVAATAYSPFLFWDGRKDSLWAQALGPLESPVEHGGDRTQYAETIARHYREEYESVFGARPDLRGRDGATQVFVNIGKAIAAYERRIGYGPSRLDGFLAAWRKAGTPPRSILTSDERAGLALFVGKANCTQCHNGPLLTNNEFHNTGVPAHPALPQDHGRIRGLAAAKTDEFNCHSRWSDSKGDCPELDYLPPADAQLERAFKVPSLRNVADRSPYMHAGQFQTLAEVLDHYNRAPAAPAGHTELKPLGLDRKELEQLEAFLRSLSGGLSAPPGFLATPSLPTE